MRSNATRIEPGRGQESVWDYPRPPRVEACRLPVRIEHCGVVVAESTGALRVLETSHPPGIYLPPGDIDRGLLRPALLSTVCEFKGRAVYWDLVVAGQRVEEAAWSYAAPAPGFERLAGYLSFYPGRVDSCLLGNEQVTPQQGRFYGGWITHDVVGPFKGGPGTIGW